MTPGNQISDFTDTLALSQPVEGKGPHATSVSYHLSASRSLPAPLTFPVGSGTKTASSGYCVSSVAAVAARRLDRGQRHPGAALSRLMDPALFEVFARRFIAEWNRQQADANAEREASATH